MTVTDYVVAHELSEKGSDNAYRTVTISRNSVSNHNMVVCHYLMTLMRNGSRIVELVQVLDTGEQRYLGLSTWAQETGHAECLRLAYGSAHE